MLNNYFKVKFNLRFRKESKCVFLFRRLTGRPVSPAARVLLSVALDVCARAVLTA